MKHMIRFSLLCLMCVAIYACSSKKSSTASTNPPATTTTSTPPVPPIPPAVVAETAPAASGTVRFVVSFYSVGGGIDLAIKDEFVRFLNAQPKKIAYEPQTWGREGEVDFCFGLKELSAAEQASFIKKANEILSRSKLVHKKENAACDHISWPEPTAETTPAADTYRFWVSFYSTGEGIDLKNKEEFEKFLNSYPKKIAYEPTRWGREGETDYCLKLNELSSTEQADFIKKAKEVLAKSRLVHVDENAKCVHKH